MKLAVLRFLPILLILLLVGCDQSEPTASDARQDNKWSEYISAHTAGTVSKYSTIRVRFVNDVVNNEQLGKPVDLLSADPAIPGKAMFINPGELVLEPESPLSSGQRYQFTLATSSLKAIPARLGNFKFDIDVIKQDFEIKIEGLTTSPDNDNAVMVNGTLTTADKEEADRIEAVLSANYLAKSQNINWEHNVDGRHHSFTITGLERQQQNMQLELSWNGSTIGVDNSGKRSVEIPAAGIFKLSRVHAVQADRQYIEVIFSDQLDKTQNLRGLITLNRGKYNTQLQDNRIKVYPDSNLTGEVSITINAAVRSSKGRKLGSSETRKVFFMSQKPQVRFAGKGVILPENKFLSIPFEAVNVDSVQVTAFRIYENNIGQFLQTNKLGGNNELQRVGRYLWRKTIKLPHAEQDKWNRYSLDATELLRQHPGALFRLTLSINRGNSLFSCSSEENSVPVVKEGPLKNNEDLHVQESSGWDFADDYYNSGQQSEWRDRQNPCKDSYYKHASGVTDSRNFMASNIGIIAKRGDDNTIHVVTTDLRTSAPLPGVKLTFLNFQNQPLGNETTDKQGMALTKLDGRPFYLIANQNNQRGYLKLSKGSALPTSHFNVGGEKIEQGLKGYIYGERGVWRPGDDIYLTFVLQDKQNVIPDSHPVTMNLYNPKGQLIQSATNNKPVGDFYAFKLKTDEDDLTGNWIAKAILGGKTFSKKIKIETVIPNRLKVELDFGKDTLYASDMPLKGKLFGQWLHGATAAGLKADVAVRLHSRNTSFNTFSDFEFDDPAREFSTDRQVIFEGNLDSQGYAEFEKDLQPDDAAPGMLTASFTSRVFEKSGAFSTSTMRMPFHPYRNYLGIKLPKGDETRNMLLTDTVHKVQIASIDAEGNPVDLNNVEVTLYKIKWKWWWDQSGESLARYARASYNSAVKQDTIATHDGRGTWEFEIKYPTWGRYLVRACDKVGQHCTGKVFYIDWPGWAGRAREQSGPGANALNFSTDKSEYQVGETAHITLPEATQGRALISIENGSRILSQRWLELKQGQTGFDIPLTRDMAPNVYVSVTLIQPHQDKGNDRPIRLYGITPLLVNDPATRLKPVLTTADEWSPQSTAKIDISEQQGKAMTYTLAVVDEGLLGLTNFKTPDLHRYFYKKEALGVSTWDLFDDVTGAYGGELERLLSLGGGADDSQEPASQKKKRFPPVVKFLGPFELAAGKSASHKVKLPQYIGAVRVMAVAGKQGAYGLADKSVVVRDALSLLATVPRIIGPGETLTVPVTLFTTEPDIKQVQLRVEVDDHFAVIDDNQRSISFTQPGEQMGFIKIKTGNKLGKGHLKFIASSGKYRSESEIYLQVRSPNPRTIRQTRHTLEVGESWDATLKPHGLPGTNAAMLEVSAVPPLNLERRLQYLIRYPHGCVEQVTSSVFPQLYLGRLIALDKKQQQDVENNINAAIDRLRQFQHSSGGFMYWPASGQLNDWATNYAGHFLVEANKLGYQVPTDMLYNWINHQKTVARDWVTGSGRSELDQAYRLYTLALAGDPAIGAMNRLRESDQLSNTAHWQLATAYALIGQTAAAQELVSEASLDVEEYASPGHTFGSRLRDQAIILRSLSRLGYQEDAGRMAQRISEALSADHWHSTQSIAFALLGMARFVGDEGAGQVFNFSYRIGENAPQTVQAKTPIHQQQLTGIPQKGAMVQLNNTTQRKLYATLTTSGIPPAGEEQADSEGLGLEVYYTDTQGRPMAVDRLTQGSDIVALVTVRNQTQRKLENIALTHMVPSGWEIHNARLQGDDDTGSAKLDYQDIRDDRIYSYFSLNPGEARTIRTVINATYLGKYYLPGISVEAMYDAKKHARSKGQWIEVVPQP